MAVVLRNGIRNCLEAAGVVAQGDGFAGRSFLVVLIFLVSRQHEIFVAVVVEIGESETARPPVGLREDGIWGYGKPVGTTHRELVWLKRTTRVTLLNKGMVVGERTEEEIEILIVIDVAPSYSVSPPVFGYLVGNAFLLRYVGEGNARRSWGRRRHLRASRLLNTDQC